MVRLAHCAELRTHSNMALVGEPCAGMTTTLGAGAAASVKLGTISIPPLALMGVADSATVEQLKRSMRFPIMTLPKTSQGPAKSMTTASLEIRNATGMLPSAGG